jgi:GT2 family glycosyltransferase
MAPSRPATIRPPSPVAMSTIPVTVAVCTYNRPHTLVRAVRSLLGQNPPPAEILVVDNGPDQSSRDLVARDFPGVRAVVERTQGLDFARNRALETASQDIVIFLDDDAVASPGWAAAMAGPLLDDRTVGATTGRVEPLAVDTEGQRLFEANGGFSRGTLRIQLPEDANQPLHGRSAPLIAWAVSVGSGCSLGIRRTTALQLGGFDRALDLGAELPGGGDHDMLWRMLEAGFRVVYQPAAVAQHEHRRELEEAMTQIVGHQRALIALLTKHVTRKGGKHRWQVAAFLGWRLFKPGVRLVRRAAGKDPLPARTLFRMWMHCWLGLLAYPRARSLARRRAAGASN